jgi:hypothetical protein
MPKKGTERAIIDALFERDIPSSQYRAQFRKQFHVFHQGKGREKENCADANGEFLNGCSK